MKTRARRTDADRNVEAIIQAGLRVLARDPNASMAAIASASGLARATVYGHFESSSALLSEILRRAIGETEEALAAADLEAVPDREALERFVTVAWNAADPYRLIRASAPASVVAERAKNVKGRLQGLLQRGQDAGAFRDDVPAGWLADVVEQLIFRTSDGVSRGELADDKRTLESLWRTVDAVCAPQRDPGFSPR